jgi:hypothetical protein
VRSVKGTQIGYFGELEDLRGKFDP